jgi:adenine phosphoribosyltransferase
MENDRRKINQEDLELLKEKVNKIPDFPSKGVLFYDLFSILNDVELSQKLFQTSVDVIVNFLIDTKQEVTAIVGLESRGFLLGLVIADRMKLPFVPIRKKNKLPGNLYKINYLTEYSQDQIELQADSLNENSKVFIVDDLMATGGTMKAAEDLIKMAKSKIVGYYSVFEIVALEGRKKLSNEDSLVTLIKI